MAFRDYVSCASPVHYVTANADAVSIHRKPYRCLIKFDASSRKNPFSNLWDGIRTLRQTHTRSRLSHKTLYDYTSVEAESHTKIDRKILSNIFFKNLIFCIPSPAYEGKKRGESFGSTPDNSSLVKFY